MHAQELHSCGNSDYFKVCLVYGGGLVTFTFMYKGTARVQQYNSNYNIKSMQKYAKLCETMWKYAKVCIVNGYLASLPSIQL